MLKIDDALRNVTRLFLDTAPVIYYVEKNPTYLAIAQICFDRIDNDVLIGVTSPVTLAETLVVPCRLTLIALQQDFSDLIVSGHNMIFLPIDDATAREAAALRARYNLTLTDAFQVAVALRAGCEAFLTNDLGLKRVTELCILVLDELEL